MSKNTYRLSLIAISAAMLIPLSGCKSTLAVGETTDALEAPAKDYLSAAWAKHAWKHARGADRTQANQLADQLYAHLDSEVSEYPTTSPQVMAEELLDFQVNAEHYYLYGRVLQSEEQHQSAVSAYQIALELEPADPGLILARLASVYSQLQKPDTAYRYLESSIKAGFNGFVWINQSPELGYLHQHPEFRDRYLAMLPETMTHEQLNLGGNFDVYYGRGGTSYIFCDNGRFRQEYAGEGYWSYENGSLKLETVRWCDEHYDEATDSYKLTCSAIPQDEAREAFTFLEGPELQQVLAQSDQTDVYFDARSDDQPEPDFCSESWD